MKYWVCTKNQVWEEIELDNFEKDAVIDFIQDLGFSYEPDIVLGDEFNFIASFENPKKDQHLFHMELDGFQKIFFAEGLPSFFQCLELANNLIHCHFRTKRLMEMMRDE